MRRTAVRFFIAVGLVCAGILPILAQETTPPPANPGVAAQDSPRTLSMTLRVRPDELVKAGRDLARMVSTGAMVGLPFLQELSRAISAEVAVERDVPGGGASRLRMSSDAWTRRSSAGEPVARARPLAPGANPAPVPAVAASGLSICVTCTAAWATLVGQAAAIRSGAEALARQAPDDKAGAVADAVSQARRVAADLARTARAASAEVRRTGPRPAPPR